MWSAEGEGAKEFSPHEIQKVCRKHRFFKDFKKLMNEPILNENEKEKNFIEVSKKHEDAFTELVEFFDFVNKDN